VRNRELQLRTVLAVTVLTLTLALSTVRPYRVAADTLAEPTWNCILHCWGAIVWNGGTSGIYTSISVTSIYSNSQDYFVNNEGWMANVDQGTWVEAGYKALYGERRYFWEDFRPGDINPNRYLLAAVPSADIGGRVGITLSRTSSNSFDVILQSNTYTLRNYSTNNSMQPDSMQIGQEVFAQPGTTTAPEASWIYNQWREDNGTWHFQNRLQDDYRNNSPPIHSQWAQFPTDAGSNGGTWIASCCYDQ